jgi:hypothetical protein
MEVVPQCELMTPSFSRHVTTDANERSFGVRSG